MKSLRKNIFREIKRSPGRFLAILGIIVLGSGFLVGLRVSQPAMIETAAVYLDEQSFFDFSISSTLGLTDDDVAAFASAEDVLSAEGSVSAAALVEGDDGTTPVITFYSLPETINLPKLIEGEMPDASGECLVDGQSEYIIGDTITVSSDNEQDTIDTFAVTEYTVVGRVTSPLYMNYERGNTSLGAGTISAYVYILPEDFNTDYYTTIYIRMKDMPDAYSSGYDDAADALEPLVTELAEERADIRYNTIVSDAEAELADGEAEYQDGLEEYNTQRADAQAELDDAWAQLQDALSQIEDGQAEIDSGWAQLNSSSDQARQELYDAQDQLDQSLVTLNDGEAEYQAGLDEYEDGFLQYQSGLESYNTGMEEYNENAAYLAGVGSQLSSAYNTITAQQQSFNTLMDSLISYLVDPSTGQQMFPDSATLLSQLRAGDQMTIAAVNAALSAMSAMSPDVPADSAALISAADALDSGWAQYNSGAAQYNAGMAQLSAGKQELDAAWEQLEETRILLEEADATLAQSRQQLDDGWAEYNAGVQEVEDGWAQLNSTIADTRNRLNNAQAELDDARAEYADGLAEYEDSKAQADQEFADAQADLDDARAELDDARAEIDDIKYPSVYVLGRWSNVGYSCFDNDTTIVASISAVFPLFFFLVAALICVTSITRMVDEQRSQLGVLMALGYGRFAIMSKFLVYSGTATVLGCALGIVIGSWIIPAVVWQAYSIMYDFSTEIVFYFSVPTSLIVFCAYFGAMLLVTWLACRRELSDTPANIIRPRAPKIGKRVLLEKIPFIWNHLSFMWKVSMRNLFRYKLRVFMMILGIGGCTALMITGFGIRDSIQHVVDDQYSEVTLYDIAVTFDEPVDNIAQDEFSSSVSEISDNLMYAYQGSTTVSAGNSEQSGYLTVVDSDSNIQNFIDFHSKDGQLELPSDGGALINIGLAQDLELEVGDSFSIRGDDTGVMTFTVSGIFDNYIYNYVYITTETYTSISGAEPEINTAFLTVPDNVDQSSAAALLLGMDNVINVSESNVMRDRIGSMMDSLIYIVLLTIVCAAALAFIVIYNLTNINITERLREIATVKVLGFYQWESAIYVLRENIVLTVLGALVGIPLGFGLNSFIINAINVDLIRFTPQIAFRSFAISLLLTFVFSILVDFLMYFRLNRINTAEALKAAE